MASALTVTFTVLFVASILMQRRTIASASDDERATYLANSPSRLRVYSILGILIVPLMFFRSSEVFVDVVVLSTLWAAFGSVGELLSLRQKRFSRAFRMRLLRARVIGVLAVAALAISVILHQ